MPSYKLFHLSLFSGHIEHTESFHASDDVEAICQVQSRRRDHPVEIWRDNRKVRRFDAAPNVFEHWMAQRPTRRPERLAPNPPDPSRRLPR